MLCDTAVVTVVVSPQPDPPVAGDITVSTEADTIRGGAGFPGNGTHQETAIRVAVDLVQVRRVATKRLLRLSVNVAPQSRQR